MPKQPSVITVAKQGNGYSVDARGAFGGGWTRHVAATELIAAITRAWQMYGSNHLGCSIVGELPADAQAIADQLQGATQGMAVLTIRVSSVQADMIRAAAESAGQSMNRWCSDVLLGAIGGGERRPHENV